MHGKLRAIEIGQLAYNCNWICPMSNTKLNSYFASLRLSDVPLPAHGVITIDSSATIIQAAKTFSHFVRVETSSAAKLVAGNRY